MKLPKVELTDIYPDVVLTGKSDCGRALWLLQKDFHVYINGKSYVVPAGFVFDFASVPRMFWSLVPPIDPLYAGAALLHDWAYAGEIWPREINDRLFLSAMIQMRVPAIERGIMYAAVRIGGGVTYKKHTTDTVRHVRMLSNIIDIKRPLYSSL